VKFWDSSAVVSLLADEEPREGLLRNLRSDGGLVVWWGTPVECMSALARREREGSLTVADANDSIARLHDLESSWFEVNPSARVRALALRLLRTHPLRSPDSLQLAAALVAAEEDPAQLGFVCLDRRLATAAQREGFSVEP